MENVYIALIINKNNYPNFSQYNRVIDLFNQKYPNNTLVFDKYLTNGTTLETDGVLDDFIGKHPTGKRVAVSITTTILTDCSNYFVRKGLVNC